MKALLLLVGLVLVGCQALPPPRTMNDIAADLCAHYFSERQGISLDDAARGVCTAREVLDPFLRELLKAQRVAGMAGEGAPAEEPAPEEPQTTTVLIVDRGCPSAADGGAAEAGGGAAVADGG